MAQTPEVRIFARLHKLAQEHSNPFPYNWTTMKQDTGLRNTVITGCIDASKNLVTELMRGHQKFWILNHTAITAPGAAEKYYAAVKDFVLNNRASFAQQTQQTQHTYPRRFWEHCIRLLEQYGDQEFTYSWGRLSAHKGIPAYIMPQLKTAAQKIMLVTVIKERGPMTWKLNSDLLTHPDGYDRWVTAVSSAPVEHHADKPAPLDHSNENYHLGSDANPMLSNEFNMALIADFAQQICKRLNISIENPRGFVAHVMAENRELKVENMELRRKLHDFEKRQNHLRKAFETVV